MIGSMENTLESPVELPVESNPLPSGEQPERVGSFEALREGASMDGAAQGD
jgi:hypothetical protein